MEYGAPIPEQYDPENWPHRFCSYQDARGFVTRVRSAGSGEAKEIAKELGVCVNSVRRAVRWYLISVGEYDPETWFAHQREEKARARRWFLDTMAQRDQENVRTNRAIRQARAGERGPVSGHADRERAARERDCTSPRPTRKTRPGKNERRHSSAGCTNETAHAQARKPRSGTRRGSGVMRCAQALPSASQKWPNHAICELQSLSPALSPQRRNEDDWLNEAVLAWCRANPSD